MTPEDFRQLEELYQSALNQRTEDRLSWVESQTEPGGIRDRLLKMLSVDQKAVDRVVEEAAESDSYEGEVVGGFRLIEAVGAGGMGTVYRAQREGTDFQQTAAIKLIRSEADPKLGARLAAERQVLASLEHPYIARMIDGGTASWGDPFVAIEFVDGQPLDDFCRGADAHSVIGVFIKICEAVQHAHQRLIVHRDIKPANVLVDERDNPRLLDFGIAKLLDAETDLSRTQTVAQIMTPAYASPEQIRGEAVTTASDIYSLGVTLYECLTGRRPFNFEGLSPAQVESLVTTQRPSPPSKARRAPALSKSSAGDLDLIVFKSMHPDPDQRYASAGAMAADLRAFLAGNPISARPDSATYRISKLVQRHPVGSLGVTAFVLMLAGAATALAIQAERLTVERDRAELEATTAAAVSDFMVDLFAVSDPLVANERDVTASELLQRGAERIQAELGDAPEAQARLLQITAQSFANAGDLDSGLPLLEQSVALFRSLGEPALNDLAETLNRLGNYRRDMGDLATAQQLIGESVRIRESLTAGENDFDLADSYNNYGLLLYDASEFDQAERALTKSLQMHRAISGDTHSYVGIALHNLALVARAVGRYALAEQRATDALRIKASLGLSESSTYANTLELLSGIERERGNFDLAANLIEQARQIKVTHFPPDHPRVVTNLRNQALLAWDQGALDEAWQQLAQARSQLMQVPTGKDRYHFSLLLLSAELLLDLGDPAAAQDKLELAEPIAKAVYGKRHVRVADWHVTAGRIAIKRPNLTKAREHFRIAETMYRALLPQNNYSILRARGHVSVVSADTPSCDLDQKLLSDLPSRKAGRLVALQAECYRRINHPDLAETARHADELLGQSLAPSHPERVRVRELCSLGC